MPYRDDDLTYYVRELYRDNPSAFFRALVEAVSLGVVAVDARRFIRYANAAAHRMFGYEQPSLIGLPLEILLPRELREKHNHHLDKFYNTPHARVMNGGQIVQALDLSGNRVSVRVALDAFEYGDGYNYVAMITPTNL